MTKKQQKEIAERWAAGLLIQCGYDSFNPSHKDEDIDGILMEITKIRERLLKKRTSIFTLEGIIKDVTTPKQLPLILK